MDKVSCLTVLSNYRFGLGKLDAAVVSQAKHDLQGADIRAVGQAVRYFFFDGTGVDENNPNAFQALCLRNKIDPDRAAKAIWNGLPEANKKKIACFLEMKSSAPVK